ncbi:serpin-ZX-like protein [Artemisia annua]|uniref:Serpin-ZX-like protein n=1 Tax=Artemisia annua TaxID=35608 RepID=A0A2U1KFF4_ARTAN|nr:serpin-ZX-like protein [Artemisia annua]
MTSKKKQFVRDYDGFKVLRLPYSQGEDERHFTMYFFLPNEKDGLPQLIQKIGSESDFLDHHMPYNRFKLDCSGVPTGKHLTSSLSFLRQPVHDLNALFFSACVLNGLMASQVVGLVCCLQTGYPV